MASIIAVSESPQLHQRPTQCFPITEGFPRLFESSHRAEIRLAIADIWTSTIQVFGGPSPSSLMYHSQ